MALPNGLVRPGEGRGKAGLGLFRMAWQDAPVVTERAHRTAHGPKRGLPRPRPSVGGRCHAPVYPLPRTVADEMASTGDKDMRTVRAWRSVVLVAFCAGWAAPPQAWAAGTAAPRAKPKADDLMVETSASVTITSTQSKFVDAAVTVPVSGKAGQDGWRVKVEALTGQYDYKAASGRTTTASKTQLTGLVGYEWTWNNARLGLFAGPTLGNTSVSPADPARRDAGVDVGGKLVAQAWWQPTKNTMASGYASYSTLSDAYYLHAKAGYAVFANVYAGPEVAFLGDDTSSQWRVGAHLTGLQLGPIQVSVAGGYLKDHGGKAGTYATVDMRGAF
jgi:hypothetical protein